MTDVTQGHGKIPEIFHAKACIKSASLLILCMKFFLKEKTSAKALVTPPSMAAKAEK